MEGLKVKIRELEEWLKHNGSHPNYSLVLQDKKELETKLKQQDEAPTATT
ncbi:hypothetical protein HX004_14195 [Myroides sp. 1354]|nr:MULTISPECIES: hypothetical protein [unclassified Myroides]MDM1045906.1 hypothetical protein [Myroides sp. R163-1]MDM1056916.1 hypothetical protein [Myroides sp. 1354]MDM1070111.1 hypothetical protein [Myroides sp. 1372]